MQDLTARLAEPKKKRVDSYMPCGEMAYTGKFGEKMEFNSISISISLMQKMYTVIMTRS